MLKKKKNKIFLKKNKLKNFKIKNIVLFRIFCTFNNTIITLTNTIGDTLYWSTSSNINFKPYKKSMTSSSQIAAERVGKFAISLGYKYSKIIINGIGFGRDYSIRGVFNSGINVISVCDVTPNPHNGCKLKKIRRN
ncbi:hypothetical protein NDNC_0960 [Candidatus Nasuia deltocephalinicola]|nr:hypothetical protein NDNC_0960 [Candidatus Nasuia deltocephalinicola]